MAIRFFDMFAGIGGFRSGIAVVEYWRLQGFTDVQFYKAQNTGLKDGRLYKMAGNAVSVPVISAIGTKLKEINERYDIMQ